MRESSAILTPSNTNFVTTKLWCCVNIACTSFFCLSIALTRGMLAVLMNRVSQGAVDAVLCVSVNASRITFKESCIENYRKIPTAFDGHINLRETIIRTKLCGCCPCSALTSALIAYTYLPLPIHILPFIRTLPTCSICLYN